MLFRKENAVNQSSENIAYLKKITVDIEHFTFL
jgi:hypothetical protein